MRSAAVIFFIALVASVALFCAQHKTVAKGSALADTLLQSNPSLRAMTCQDSVPIDQEGARFACKVVFKNGNVEDYSFAMNREGSITVVTSTDPWGK